MVEGTFRAAKSPAPEHPLNPATAVRLITASSATPRNGGIFRNRLRTLRTPMRGNRSPRASGTRWKGDAGGVLNAVFAVVTVILMFWILPPAAKGAGSNVAVAPAGSPLAAKFTLYRKVVATCGSTWMV